jgi:3-oxocholest-4-en-26-oyl-CoA dehydrogenase beta subunit
MDFGLDPEQRELAALAERIFADHTGTARLAAVERSPERIDRELWRVLADAGLLGLGIEPEWDGSGCGVLEVALVLEQQGRHVAPVPLWETLLLGAAPIARAATAAQRATWLPRVAAGQCLLTGAFENLDLAGASAPVDGRATADGFVLEGQLVSIPAGHVADRVVVPFRCDSGWYLALLDPTTSGTTRTEAVTSNRQLHAHLRLDAVDIAASECAPVSASMLEQLVDIAQVGLCASLVGVVEQAVAITAEHVGRRRQFGREIGTFQAVAMRAADAYIDTEAMRLTMLHAAWLLADERPAHAEAAAAKWWAASGAHRSVHTALHLHGGIGNDVEYPVHRYYLWGRQLALQLGGTAETLERLAELVADLR